MTPQQLNETVKRYWDVLADPTKSHDAFLAQLNAVKAAHASYESVPVAVHSLGSFAVASGEIIVVDAYGSAKHAVIIKSARKGTWFAFVGTEAVVHVALFANAFQ